MLLNTGAMIKWSHQPWNLQLLVCMYKRITPTAVCVALVLMHCDIVQHHLPWGSQFALRAVSC